MSINPRVAIGVLVAVIGVTAPMARTEMESFCGVVLIAYQHGPAMRLPVNGPEASGGNAVNQGRMVA